MSKREKTATYPLGNGFNTVQRFTSRTLVRQNELYEAENVNMFDGAGRVQTCRGYEYHSQPTSSTPVNGMYCFLKDSSNAFNLIAQNNTLYYYNTGTLLWTASNLTALSTTARVRFCASAGVVYMTNTAIARSSQDGATWGTTNLSGAPSSMIDICSFQQRLYGLTLYGLYWSDQANVSTTPVSYTWNSARNTLVGAYDGDYNVSFIPFRSRLIIFKNFSVHAFRQDSDIYASLIPISEGVGCPAPEGVIVSENGESLFFLGQTKTGELGIYQSQGDNVVLISRPVQDILRGVASNFVTSVCAGQDRGIIKFFLGTVTLGDGSTITNCELQYSVRDQGWQWRQLPVAPVRYASLVFSGVRNIYFVLTNGLLYKDEYGYDFNGTPIGAKVTTNFFSLQGENMLTPVRGITITGNNMNEVSASLIGIEDSDNPKVGEQIDSSTDASGVYVGYIQTSALRVSISWSQNEIVNANDIIEIQSITADYRGGDDKS